MGIEDIRNRRIEREVAQPETHAPSTPLATPTTPPAVTTPPPPVRLDPKYVSQPRLGSSIVARTELLRTRDGTFSTLDAAVHQAAEMFEGGVQNPRFQAMMGAVLEENGIN